MNPLNRYLVVIYVCLTLTYAIDISELKAQLGSIAPLLIMVAFVHISVAAAWFSKKWYGQLLLYTNFLLVGLIPFVLGVISIWLTSQKVKRLLPYVCTGLPLVLLLVALVASLEDGQAGNGEVGSRVVVYRLVQAVYWYAVYQYSSIHLKQELDKIEKKD